MSVISRLAAVIESLVAARFDKLLCNAAQFDNRYGFLSGRNICDLQENLNRAMWESKAGGFKSALVFLDLSSAYNLVPHKKLVIKVTQLIRNSGQISNFGVISGFIQKWLGFDGRRLVKFQDQNLRPVRGLPQGSPLSCSAFICFFDFELGSAFADQSGFLWLFADDSTIKIRAASWAVLDGLVDLVFEEFACWCSQNDQILNIEKSNVIYINRKTPPSEVPFKIEQSARSLGIILDEGFTFKQHTDHIVTWSKRRAGLLRLLRGKFEFSYKVLMRIVVSWRSKFHFGTYWLFNLAESNFSKLESAYMNLFKAATGLSKLVPFGVVSNFLGTQSLSDFLEYWFSIRSHRGYLADKEDLFASYNQLQNRTVQSSSRYSLRSSTIESTKQTAFRQLKRDFGLPARVGEWFEKCKKNCKFLKTLEMGMNYKYKLKKKLKFRREIYRLFDGSVISNGVKMLNEKYFRLYS